VRERAAVLDVLRGIAILGILAANVESFRTPEVWDGYGVLSAFDRAYLFVVYFLASGKFITALSFLFGLGLALQFRRAREASRFAWGFLARRLVVLALFGLAHALLVWSGDVLLFYAILSVPLLLFVHRRPATLVVWAFLVLGAFALFGLIVALNTFLTGDTVALPSTPPGLGETAQAAYTSGSYPAMVVQRAREYFSTLIPGLYFSGPQVFAMMLLGAAAANAGWVGDPEGLGRRARRVALVGLLAGIPLNLFYALTFVYGVGPGEPWYFGLARAAWLVGAPIMALGWMGLVALLYVRSKKGSEGAGGGFRELAAVGKMALTNYLVQSILMTAFFYGLGFYGRTAVGPALALMAVVWMIELTWSRPLLSRFRHGPAEWLWRRLSYGRSGKSPQ
jgi:uncharacterized protein